MFFDKNLPIHEIIARVSSSLAVLGRQSGKKSRTKLATQLGYDVCSAALHTTSIEKMYLGLVRNKEITTQKGAELNAYKNSCNS